MGVWIENPIPHLTTNRHQTVAPYAGAWIENESVPVYAGRLHTFLCVRKNLLFLLRVLSMYLTGLHRHIPVFRAFLHFLVTVEDSKSRLRGVWMERL